MCSFDELNSPIEPFEKELRRAGLTRREFVAMAAIAAGMLPLGSARAFSESPAKSGNMQFRTLGRTGEKVSIIGVGGAHLGGDDVSDSEATRIVRTAIDNGVNFMDNCWDYNEGRSEERMGKALQDGYRHKAFLMTKIDGRDARTATRQIDESLKRLKTDHLDLLQLHEVIRMNDPERAFAPGGAIEAMVAARTAGKTRYLGFTGHKSPEIHLQMIQVARRRYFHFDTVQMPLNIFDAHYDSFAKRVVPAAQKEGIAILGMKPLGGRFLLQTKTVSPVECLNYAMNLPVSVVITGIDAMDILKQALQVARDFKPLSEDQVAAMLNKTAQVAGNGQYEKYKTSTQFDGTHAHPEWLGPGGEQGANPVA